MRYRNIANFSSIIKHHSGYFHKVNRISIQTAAPSIDFLGSFIELHAHVAHVLALFHQFLQILSPVNNLI